jgi:hypothetical protein
MLAIDPAPLTFVLRPAAGRTVTVRGDDGKPIAGARVELRAIHTTTSIMALHQLPDDLARRFSARTGADGKAVFVDLSPRDDVIGVRIGVGGLGAQDLDVAKRLTNSGEAAAEYAIALKPPGPIHGRVVDAAGRPVAGVAIEVWTKGQTWMPPAPLKLPAGPVRTAADGSFRTPTGLVVGSSYRVVVRHPESNPILTPWTKADEQPRRLPDVVLRPLRSIVGRVVDRRGVPLEGVEVFQSGDGPEPATTCSGPDGRFALVGFRPEPVFLFARGAGFRFHGQLVKEDVSRVELVLTRETEEPARAMATLPDLIPSDESRALARTMLEPYLATALARGDDRAKYWALRPMITIDPASVLEKLDSISFHSPSSRDEVRNRLVVSLATTDPEEAAAVAEAVADPATRAGVLVDLADALPDSERARKLAALDQAALQARAATKTQDKLFQMGEVAERWYELGEADRARTLFAESRTLAGQFADKSDPILGLFAARLSRVDMAGALGIVQGMANKQQADEALANIAVRIAADNPAEAEHILRRIENPLGRVGGICRACLSMAASDPARARRIVKLAQGAIYRADALLFLAVGLKGRDRRASVEAFRAAVIEIDRYLEEQTDEPFRGRQIAGTLALVEQIDPALVPEVFWRAVAARPSIGDPRKTFDYPSIRIAPLLARYDREAAAVLLRPIRAELERSDDLGSRSALNFIALALIDPRGAAARLAAIGSSPKADADSNWAITEVAECLARSGPARWRWVWSRMSELGSLMTDRDVRW